MINGSTAKNNGLRRFVSAHAKMQTLFNKCSMFQALEKRALFFQALEQTQSLCISVSCQCPGFLQFPRPQRETKPSPSQPETQLRCALNAFGGLLFSWRVYRLHMSCDLACSHMCTCLAHSPGSCPEVCRIFLAFSFPWASVSPKHACLQLRPFVARTLKTIEK